MAQYTHRVLANAMDVSTRTFRRRLRELEDERKFKKKSRGRWFSDTEASRLSALLDFSLEGVSANGSH